MFKPQLVTLQRGALRLEPLSDADIPALVALAEANREELLYMSGTQRLDWYRSALADLREQRALPFVIRLGDELVGTTRFADFMNTLPACEIGWTWLDRNQHGSGLNTTIKYLMLRHAFDNWGMVRVQLKTAASNQRSQRAIEKLGAVREGLLRNHRRLADGRLDDTVLYSITDLEWPALREAMEAGFVA
ncbi:N-acetyltransferase GCN5 [Ectopseudomonas mendocina]|jgi:RimJ/RimL family protein N-acetyltransferase|uniref:N-acetyltransferase n=2 Tax=Ectopseudomonas mendocina TaxID=300 RepID=A0A379IRS5_ECTME|nr:MULTISPECIES: GNAT family protein [Pseudomonas]MBL0951046.1 GNAT family N-acetyltransferase [Pseudomonas sp.]AEB59687.1 GCN5-related N-acetyltransferase [Pseudomonas mendocina NK-01]ALN18302.1 GCN5 family acetyltransferase [Pseudomonas mendocina S5.2]KES00856.1 GCN5 family acetyltransferase [Pseudomonas mendocina]TRO14316.1 N-acetyltransferase [Pseudomonas mendocina]